MANEHTNGKGAPLGLPLGKDRRQMSAWLSGRIGISDDTAREFEDHYMKPSGWLDTDPSPDERKSHFGRIDAGILHEAETLVLSDELVARQRFRPKERAERLAAAYNRLAHSEEVEGESDERKAERGRPE